ncbi:MAG: hypothetical protein L0206_21905, partial [Actinobacteria bacterium]|nr:hypothetical protein [Actinomycetota bacterium]
MLFARSAAAFCNDGILQPSEQCDSTALPNGSAACPGRCIQPPNLEACQCANLSNDIRDFAIIADLQARISSTAAVISGGVAGTTDGGFLYVGANALTPGSDQAIGDRCRLLPGSNVGRLFCNEPLVLPGAFVNNGGPFFFGPPVTFSNLPAFPTFLGGGSDVTVVSGDTQYLAPGSYGTIVVSPKGTLVLHGLDLSSGVGSYDVLAVKVMGGAKLFADNPVQVNVSNGFRLTGDSVLGPTPGTSLQPGDVEV